MRSPTPRPPLVSARLFAFVVPLSSLLLVGCADTTGVGSSHMQPPHAASRSTATTTVTVPGTAAPWNTAVNQPFNFASPYSSAAAVVDASSGLSFATGTHVTITYVGGAVSIGDGYAPTDANGFAPYGATNTFNGFPAFYIPSPPLFSGALLGTFATSGGVIVGAPFGVGDGPVVVAVPAGASELLLGVNDNYYGDNTGSFSVAVTSASPFDICPVYDPTKAVRSGSTLPVKLELCDDAGNDLSASGTVLHAAGVALTTTTTSGAVQDAGNANPDSDFRFDATLGTTGGYIFNLSTKGLTTGTYKLTFTVSGDPSSYATLFQVK